MRPCLATAILACLGLASSFSAAGAAVKEQRPRRSTELPRPRDGDVAVREELDAARRAGTREAYDLFLSRHGDHKLAEAARRERGLLAARRP